MRLFRFGTHFDSGGVGVVVVEEAVLFRTARFQVAKAGDALQADAPK